MSVGLQRLRDEPDVIRQGAVDKGEDESVIDAALDADKRRRDLLGQVERDRAQRNQWSQDVGRMIREGADPKSGAVEDLRRASRQAGERIEIAERELRDVEVKVEDLLLRIPNPADPDVPVGGEDANKTVRTWGEILPKDFRKPHWEIG
jgi:seryl-tRNA synthetase